MVYLNYFIGFLILLTVMVFFGSIYSIVKINNEYYEKEMNMCVSNQGSWIPTSNGNSVCLRQGK